MLKFQDDGWPRIFKGWCGGQGRKDRVGRTGKREAGDELERKRGQILLASKPIKTSSHRE